MSAELKEMIEQAIKQEELSHEFYLRLAQLVTHQRHQRDPGMAGQRRTGAQGLSGVLPDPDRLHPGGPGPGHAPGGGHEDPAITPEMTPRGPDGGREAGGRLLPLLQPVSGLSAAGEARAFLEQMAKMELGHKEKVEFLYANAAFPEVWVAGSEMGEGVLIALEGVDGAGKTTQALGLAGTLAKFGHAASSPGSSPTGGRGRLQAPPAKSAILCPGEEFALFEVDRRAREETIRRSWRGLAGIPTGTTTLRQPTRGPWYRPWEIIAEMRPSPPPGHGGDFYPAPDAGAGPASRAGGRGPGQRKRRLSREGGGAVRSFTGPHVRRVDASGPPGQVLEGPVEHGPGRPD